MSSELNALERQKKNESHIVRYMKARPKALYDIGVGPKTEWQVLREIFPELHAFGVEANPEMVKDIERRGWEGPLLNKAISLELGFLTLKLYREDGLDASLLHIPNRPVARQYQVPAMTLDQADEQFGQQSDILLWIDIEGEELAALKSGTSLMHSGRVKWINLEVREESPWEGGCNAQDIEQHLTSIGYRKIVDYNFHPASRHWDVIYFHESAEQNSNPVYNWVPAL